jgi:hypothetical protein
VVKDRYLGVDSLDYRNGKEKRRKRKRKKKRKEGKKKKRPKKMDARK